MTYKYSADTQSFDIVDYIEDDEKLSCYVCFDTKKEAVLFLIDEVVKIKQRLEEEYLELS